MQQRIQYGTFTDSRDGEVYRTVKIGNQIWMAENLRYRPNKRRLKKFGDSNPIFLDYAEIADLVDDLTFLNRFQIVINEFMLRSHVITKEDIDEDLFKLIKFKNDCKQMKLTAHQWHKFGCLYRWTRNINRLAPEGWKIPSNTDFMNLAQFLDQSGCEKPAIALKCRKHWAEDKYYGCGGTDEFGFCALPSGFFNIEYFHRDDLFRTICDLTQGIGSSAHYWTRQKGALDCYFNSTSSIYWGIDHYHRNEYPIEIQHEQDFFRNGSVSRNTYLAIRCIKEECSVDDNNNKAIISIYTPPRPKLKVPESIEEDEPWTPQFGTFKDKRDKRTYKTVKIGNQEWFAEDLKYNSDGLYTYDEAVKSLPKGWHLPSRIEVDELRDFCCTHSKNAFGTVIKSKTGWLPCTDYYANLNERDFKESLRNAIHKAPPGTDRFGLSITPAPDPQRKGKNAFLWLDCSFGKIKYLWNISYISDDYMVFDVKPTERLIVRCMRECP